MEPVLGADEIVVLRAQLHQANTTITAQKDLVQRMKTDINNLVEANRRGDTEYRKLQAVIAKSKEMQHVSMIMDEKETYAQQARALQELLRQNAEELEKYKKLVASNQAVAGIEAEAAPAVNEGELTALRQRVASLESSVQQLEAKISSAETAGTSAGAETGEGEDAGLSADRSESVSVWKIELSSLSDQLTTARETLRSKEEEMEAASSAAIKASRLQQRLEREAREKEEAMVKALQEKENQVAQLMRKCEALEANHSRDLQGLYMKLKERDTEIELIRGNAQRDVAAMQKKLDDASRTVAMSDSVQRLTEASKAANAAIEALEAANKELEDKVRAKDKKIEALTKKCGEAESHLQEMTGSLDETASALAASEKAEKDLRARTSVLESQLASLSEEIDTLRPMRSGFEELQERAENYESQFEIANEKAREFERRVEALQTALTDAETRIEDQKAEHAIATRMLKQMNKELKSQLAKGLSSRDLKPPSSPAITPALPAASATLPQPPQPSTPGSANVSPLLQSSPGFASLPPRPPVADGGPSRRGSQLGDTPPSDDETIQLLAKRIQNLLAENEGIKEKVRFLENIVQEVTREKDSYKSMMKQLTSSKSVVEGTTTTAQSVVDRATRSENPIRVLQSLLLKALTENERLKSDLRVLGSELDKTTPA